jgi:hypothetical protein
VCWDNNRKRKRSMRRNKKEKERRKKKNRTSIQQISYQQDRQCEITVKAG